MSALPSHHQLTIYADYHQFYVMDSSAPLDATGNPDFWAREAFRRMLADGRGLFGVSTESVGDVPVTLHVDRGAPALDLAAWDHVVEVGLELSTGTLIVCGCLQPREEGLHLQLPAGSYTARVCAAGLDTVVNEEGDDRYSVFLWPAAADGVRVLKQWSGRSYA